MTGNSNTSNLNIKQHTDLNIKQHTDLRYNIITKRLIHINTLLKKI